LLSSLKIAMHKGTSSYGMFSSKSLTWESNIELEIALKYVMDARACRMCKLQRTKQEMQDRSKEQQRMF